MYDEALLKELTELENTVRFDSFDFNDAYALGSALRAAGKKAPKPIAVRIVLDGMILYQSFLPGTDATNNNWMDKKQRTVQLTGTTSLRAAVENTSEGREGMALGQYIAGMGFSNVGLGIVHSMAHGLSALYDTPHGVACAIILPTGLEYNKTVAGERYRAVGKAMGVTGIDEMNDVEAADATIAAVKKLSADVGIPADLKGILKEEDIQFLAESAFADACCPGNPRDTSVEEIKELYRSLM